VEGSPFIERWVSEDICKITFFTALFQTAKNTFLAVFQEQGIICRVFQKIATK